MNEETIESPDVSEASDDKKASRAFRTIAEVSEELKVPAYVLRFWEKNFAEVSPVRRAGDRRYYRPEDIALLKKIEYLLYKQGYTIKGVQKLLKEGALSAVSDQLPLQAAALSLDQQKNISQASLDAVLSELEEIAALLKPA